QEVGRAGGGELRGGLGRHRVVGCERRGDHEEGEQAEHEQSTPWESARTRNSQTAAHDPSRWRGSMVAMATSTIKLAKMTTAAAQMTVPCATGYSWRRVASSSRRPMPGREKIDSVTTAPPSRKAA